MSEDAKLTDEEILEMAKGEFIKDQERLIFEDKIEETLEGMKDKEQFMPYVTANITKSEEQKRLYNWAKNLDDKATKKSVQLEQNFQTHVSKLEEIIELQTELQNKTYTTQEEVDALNADFRKVFIQSINPQTSQIKTGIPAWSP